MKFGSFHASNERINFDSSRILDISVCFRPESQKSPHVFLSIENISNESLEKFIKEARRTRVIKKSRETNSSTASNHDFIKHLDHSPRNDSSCIIPSPPRFPIDG